MGWDPMHSSLKSNWVLGENSCSSQDLLEEGRDQAWEGFQVFSWGVGWESSAKWSMRDQRLQEGWVLVHLTHSS